MFASIRPPGAMRLVPTLMTIRIVCRLDLPATDWIWNLPLLFLYRDFALEKPGEFGGRDNSSILPLEWLSGKLKILPLWILCLLPTPPAASPTGWRIMFATALAILRKSLIR